MLTLFIALLMLVMGIISQAAQVNNALTADTEDFSCLTDMCLICRLQTFGLLLPPAVFIRLGTRDVSQLLMAVTEPWPAPV